MPNYFIVEQLVKVGQGENSELVPMPVKTIGNAPNDAGKENGEGEIPDFIRIPPIIRLYVGADTWKSPKVMPSHEDMLNITEKPVVHTLTLNPRTGNINWHAGLGKGERLDVCPKCGKKKIETLKPVSGTALTMPHKLASMVGLPLATAIVSLIVAEMEALHEKQAAAQAKRAAKAKDKPEADRKPVKKGRKPTKAELQTAEGEARLLAWAAARQAV